VDGNNTITFDPGIRVELTTAGPAFTGTIPLTIDGNGSTIDGNNTLQIFQTSATVLVTIRDIELVDGDTGGTGGAIRTANGPVRVENATLRSNAADNGGGAIGAVGTGAITVQDTLILASDAGAGNGGAIGAGNSTVTVTASRVAGSQAGGAGGAILADDVDVVDSTFNTNVANDPSGGGAIHAVGDLEVLNSTFFENTAAGPGGALRVPTGSVTLRHVSMSGDASPAGAHLSSNGAVTLFAVSFDDPRDGGGNCSISINVTSSYSRSTDATCSLDGTGDVQNAAGPRLGSLRDNGGGVLTMYPLWASPLVGAIPTGDCDPDLGLDQRGIDRPFETGCDIGAIEATYPSHPFVDSAAWVESAVRWITSPLNAPEPIMTGITPTTFEPNDPITRAQVSRAKYRLAGSPDVSALPAHPFTDVPAWVTDAVRWASANSLVTGITPTRFKPNDAITRGQVARMDYRLAINPDAWADPDNAPMTVPFRPSP